MKSTLYIPDMQTGLTLGFDTPHKRTSLGKLSQGRFSAFRPVLCAFDISNLQYVRKNRYQGANGTKCSCNRYLCQKITIAKKHQKGKVTLTAKKPLLIHLHIIKLCRNVHFARYFVMANGLRSYLSSDGHNGNK